MDMNQIPTYYAGIAQSKAHRTLSVLTTGWLKKHSITMLQWFVLGLTYEAGVKGIRITDIAIQLDTTKSFVTNHVNVLELKGLLSRTVDPNDTRSRIVTLTEYGRSMVTKVEQELRADMRSNIFKTIEPNEFAIYIKVMSQLSTLTTNQ